MLLRFKHRGKANMKVYALSRVDVWIFSINFILLKNLDRTSLMISEWAETCVSIAVFIHRVGAEASQISFA